MLVRLQSEVGPGLQDREESNLYVIVHGGGPRLEPARWSARVSVALFAEPVAAVRSAALTITYALEG